MRFCFYLTVCLVGTSRIGAFLPVVCFIIAVRNCAVSVYVFVARPSDGKFLRGVNKYYRPTIVFLIVLVAFCVCFQSESNGLCDIGCKVKAKCIPATAYFLIELPYTAVIVLDLIFFYVEILICRNSNGISYNNHITLRLCSELFGYPSDCKRFTDCHITAYCFFSTNTASKCSCFVRIEIYGCWYICVVIYRYAIQLCHPFATFSIVEFHADVFVAYRGINC